MSFMFFILGIVCIAYGSFAVIKKRIRARFYLFNLGSLKNPLYEGRTAILYGVAFIVAGIGLVLVSLLSFQK